MKLKFNYVIIPLIVFAIASIGSLFTTPNLNIWYKTLTLPSFAPPGQIIGLVWSILYILIALSIILVWNKLPRDKDFRTIIGVFVINGFLNAFWSYVFFSLHQVGFAILVSAVMALTIYALVWRLWKPLRTSAYLLIPYALWVTFATYLNYVIYTLNR